MLSPHCAKVFRSFEFRRSGFLFSSLYLKQCAVHLQQYYSDSCIRDKKPSISVCLSRAGIPTIIPVHHRHIIMSRGERGDRLVRLYLSWFSVCRVLLLAKRISKATFSSIVEPVKDMDSIHKVASMIKDSFATLQPLYMPCCDPSLQRDIVGSDLENDSE